MLCIAANCGPQSSSQTLCEAGCMWVSTPHMHRRDSLQMTQLHRCNTCKSGIYVITQHLPMSLSKHVYERVFGMYVQRLYNLQLQVTHFVICTDFDWRSAFACPLAFAIACDTTNSLCAGMHLRCAHINTAATLTRTSGKHHCYVSMHITCNHPRQSFRLDQKDHKLR